jgi:hypothetical protein
MAKHRTHSTEFKRLLLQCAFAKVISGEAHALAIPRISRHEAKWRRTRPVFGKFEFGINQDRPDRYVHAPDSLRAIIVSEQRRRQS